MTDRDYMDSQDEKILQLLYSVCHKFLRFGGFQIPLNPPFSKGDFNSNSLQFPPFLKGGRGDYKDSRIKLLSLLQKCLSTEIPSIYARESGGTGFPACAEKSLNLKNIILIFFLKEHLGKLRVINAAPTFNTLLHRLESLCHQPKLNFASASLPFAISRNNSLS